MAGKSSEVTLAGSVAIVTGGGRGIGGAIALAYAGVGAAVVIAARTGREIEAMRDEIRATGGRALAVVTDISHPKDVDRLVAATIETFGQIDVLVNNAGVPGPRGLLHEISEEEWDRAIDINLKGMFLCCKYVLPHMIARQRGNIVNISSGAGVKQPRERVRSLPYQVSKFGVEGLTDALAAQMRPYGINVNSLLPGRIATQFHERVPGGQSAEHMGKPEDVVPAAVYLAALRPGELTGQTLRARDFLT